jgi:hypothetical protein
VHGAAVRGCLLLLAGCGRIGFEPLVLPADDAGVDAMSSDAGLSCATFDGVFCDDFESGSLDRWERTDVQAGGGTAVLDPTRGRGGGASCHLQVGASDGSIELTTDFPLVAGGELYLRAHLFVPSSLPDQVIDFLLLGVEDEDHLHVSMDEGGHVAVWSFGGLVPATGVHVPRDRFFCVVLRVVIGPAGSIEATVDGELLVRIEGSTLPRESGGYRRVGIGPNGSPWPRAGSEIWVDDLYLATTPLGCD